MAGPRVAVVGSGVAGAGTAFALAAGGAEVVVVDSVLPGQATAAGAGIIQPWSSTATGPAYELYAAGAAYYPTLIERLAEVGVADIGYRVTGSLVAQADAARLDEVEERLRRRTAGVAVAGTVERLGERDARALFPPLAPELGAVYVSGGARVDGRMLRAGLLAGARRLGAVVVDAPARLVPAHTGTCAVHTPGGDVGADVVVVAAGAWVNSVVEPLGYRLAVEPQRGQIAHLLLEDRETGGAGAMRFKHLLVREVAYGSLAKADRAPLHERFAQTLEAEAGDRRGEFAEILAHHAEQAFTLSAELRLPREVLVPRAIRAGVAALALAERAEERGDLALVERFLAVAERAAEVADDEGLHKRKAFLRVRALLLAGRLDEARSAAIAALSIARESGDLAHAARIARSLAQAEAWGGVLDDARQAFSEARRLSVAAGDAAGVIEVDGLDLDWRWGDGRFSEFIDGGIALSKRAQAIGDETQAAQIMSRVIGAARIAGKLELANHHLAVARKTAERLGLRALLRELRSNESACIWIAGDTSAAMAISDEVMIEAAGDGDANRLVATSRRMAEMLESEGRYEEAVVAGMAALAESLHTGERWNRSEIHGHLAVNLLRVGRIDEAEANAAAADALRAAILAEAGNSPTTPEADAILRDRGIQVIPDILCSAGGLLLGYFEWVQDTQAFHWADREIASELVVSTNTVRTHMRHIYAKLDAHSRSEAVARAREHGLVAPGSARG